MDSFVRFVLGMGFKRAEPRGRSVNGLGNRTLAEPSSFDIVDQGVAQGACL